MSDSSSDSSDSTEDRPLGSHQKRTDKEKDEDQIEKSNEKREVSTSREELQSRRSRSRDASRKVSRSRSKSRKRSRSTSRERSLSPGEKRRRRNREKSPLERKSKRNDRKSSSPNAGRGKRERRSSSRSPGRDKKVRKSTSPKRPEDPGKEAAVTKSSTKKKDELLTTKTGGAYIPPAKLRMMQQNITDKGSEAYQRLAWEALKKSINGLINKVNSPNIAVIVRELFAENIVRGRGLLCQSIIQAQTASPTFTHVYAALAAIINTKFPNIGELLLKRLILNFKRGFKRNDKTRCTSSVRFIAHMVNQQVAHEVLSLEILTLLLENPTDDSAEVAITFLKEVGQKLSEVSPRGIHAIFERLRHVLHESTLDKRTQYMIEVMFQVRKDGFKDNPSIPEELDLVEEDDQFTHMITLDDATGGEEILNVFKHDPEYEENENKYGAIKAELLEEGSGDSSGSESGSDSDSSDDDEDAAKSAPIVDATETNLISLRRTIYLTIQSALDFEEAVHKLLKLNIKPGQEAELCHMIIDCCAQQRTYEKFFGLMGQRFCQVTRTYQDPFSQIFLDTYNTVHRLETGKLRNVAKFYAHLLYTDAIGWAVLSVIKLNEDDTTSSSRIFIKILFQELAEFMGLAKLVERTRDGSMAEAWEGLLPRDNPRDTRFAINFFTSIGLGGLTEDLRSHLKTAPKPTAVVAPMVRGVQESSSSSSSESSSDSEEERERRKKKKNKKKVKKDKKKRRDKSESISESEDSESNRRRHRMRKSSEREVGEKYERRKRDHRGRKGSEARHLSSTDNESVQKSKRMPRESRTRVKSEPRSDDERVRHTRRSNEREGKRRERSVDIKVEADGSKNYEHGYSRDRSSYRRQRSRSDEREKGRDYKRNERDRSRSKNRRSKYERDRHEERGRQLSRSRSDERRDKNHAKKYRDKSRSNDTRRLRGRSGSREARRQVRDDSPSPPRRRRGSSNSPSPLRIDRKRRHRSPSTEEVRHRSKRYDSNSPPRRR